jgi:hypothetical protein
MGKIIVIGRKMWDLGSLSVKNNTLLVIIVLICDSNNGDVVLGG